jgi:hypothetical protein
MCDYKNNYNSTCGCLVGMVKTADCQFPGEPGVCVVNIVGDTYSNDPCKSHP